MYLSNDTNGNPVLTLWLSNSTQDAFSGRSATEGEFYGYLNGGLYSDWSSNLYNNYFTVNYPMNMYGTSYIRAVTLNNGGAYVSSISASGSTAGAVSTLSTATKSTSNVFAPFTMDEFGLTDYIVTPNKVSWQKDQSSITTAVAAYTYANESLGTPTTQKIYSGSYGKVSDMFGNQYYSAWGEDKLWLPSLAETGYSDSNLGMWGVSVNQRKNYNGSTTSSLGSVGSTSGNYAYADSWLRSGNYNISNSAYHLFPSGASVSSNFVHGSYAVRPALHLNLKSVNDTLYIETWEDYASTSYASGSGTASSPYIIKTPEQLAKLAVDSRNSNLSGKYYKLGANIDLSAHIWSGIGSKEMKFAGNFNGGFYCIKSIKTSSDKYIPKGISLGLFAEIISPAKIENVIMKGGLIEVSPVIITGTNNDSGIIVGKCETNCIIQNCIVEGVTVKGITSNSSAGGIAGCFTNGTIRNCIVKNCKIDSEGTAGGVCGWRGTIVDCAVIDSKVNKGWTGEWEISIGWSDNSTVVSSYAYANCNGTLKKIMYGDSSAWGNWSYSPNLNGGYPIQKTLFAIGGLSGSTNVYNYLTGILKFSVA